MAYEREIEAILDLKFNHNMSRDRIAETLGLTPRQVKRRLAKYYGENGGYQKLNFNSIPQTQITVPNLDHIPPKTQIGDPEKDEVDFASIFVELSKPTTNKDVKSYCNEIDAEFPTFMDSSLFSSMKSKKNRERVQQAIKDKFGDKPIKILTISDNHVPFHDIDAFEEAVDTHRDADVCLICGDFMDLFAVSTFPKDKNVELKRELVKAREMLELLNETFPLVIIISGNHERRLSRYITKQIDSNLQFLFKSDPIEIIAGEFELEVNVDWTYAKTRRYKKLENVLVAGDWWTQIGDCVFAHPDTFSSVPLRTVINMSQHLKARNIYHTCVVIGHTHHVGKVMRQGVLCMEIGCMCHEMDYKNSGNLSYDPWVKAYGVVHLKENGKVDFNNVNYFMFEEE